MVRATSGWLVDCWGLWCQIEVEVGCIGCAVVMVVGHRGSDNLAGVVGECCSLAEVAGVGCSGAAASNSVVGPVAALVGGGYQCYIAILLVSCAPY
jgi:hypothetical protein